MLESPTRSTIVDALRAEASDRAVAPAVLDAFEAGEADVPISSLELDSLARVELLVAIEMECDAVILPHVFARFETLGEVVDHVESGAWRSDAAEPSLAGGTDADGAAELDATSRAPRIARLFRRAVQRCRTVAEMTHLLALLTDRMTPLEFATLRAWERRGELLPPDAPAKFASGLAEWLEDYGHRLEGAGKSAPEPYLAHRVAPAAMLFHGPGERAEKTLIVGFSVMGYRTLSIGQSVLLQYLDATSHDVLIVSDIASTAFRGGVPHMGANVHEVVRWVADHELLDDYAAVRVIGCSAGAYPATLAGRAIGAEVTVGVCGRFPSERHLGALLGMHLHSWLSARRNPSAPVVLAHGVDKRRDTVFARRLGRMTGASRLAVEMPGRDLGHNILQPLAEHGELRDFFDRTILASVDADLVRERGSSATVQYATDASSASTAP